jgi:hypothetical protein
VDDAVAVGGGTDLPLLRLVDDERAVGTGAVGAGGQFLVQRPQLVFEVEVEAGHGGAEPLAFSGLLGGPQQVLEGDDVLPQVAVAFHALPPPLLSQPPTSLPTSSMALAAKA